MSEWSNMKNEGKKWQMTNCDIGAKEDKLVPLQSLCNFKLEQKMWKSKVSFCFVAKKCENLKNNDTFQTNW